MSSNKEQHQAELSLTEHLAELRTRLIRSIAAVAVGFCISYAFIEPIFALLSKPLEEVVPPGTTLIFTSYPEAFFTYLKLALTCGIFLASPFILYEIWAFVAPGLYPHEKKWALPFIVFSSLFFVGGALFGYIVVFPAAFNFLASYAGQDLKLMPSVSEYFSLTIKLLLGFGAAFELPIFMVFMALIGLIDAKMLRKNRKYALLIIFILAAILTPTPDVVNQCLLALPLLVLYEISIFLVALIGKRRESP
ncbi:MAG: twin-arginine translocase subunit TatC [Thermodesulfobacteria bacterium]|nr:twin-arginine translocase subunit TatC [Thermodesulfobacteriota bacterium]